MTMEGYTIRQAARQSGLSESTVRRLIKSGKLSAEKSEGVYRIPIESMQAYLSDRPKKEAPSDSHEDLLYREMKDRVAFLESECRHYRDLVEKLTTTRALTPGKSEPDPRGIFRRVKEWFIGRPS